jgi:hypothetical protein
MRVYSWASKFRPNGILSRPILWAGIGLSSIALIGGAAIPASAAVTHSAARTTPAAANPWKFIASYPSFQACDEVGIKDYLMGFGVAFKCVEINIGEPYFVWYLYAALPTT